MEFRRHCQGSTTVIEINGEFDATTAPEVRPQLGAIAEERPPHVIVDLSQLRLIDSSGVGAIVGLFKRVRATGGQFEVRGVNGQPLSIFRVLRLDKVFELHEQKPH